MVDKPSRNEEEYFVQQEAELQRQRRQKAAREAEQERRRSHYMKCPKCGADLKVELLRGIEVDRCEECSGVWFDAGELEAITKADGGTASALFRSLLRGVSAG
jgi:uncharacterized paraquat-inducible protein A